ncbi:MAG: VOC family protein [Acidimicrobiia bacterium]|nr:VOC family protein [Acidimicrobiia bacterium]
MRPVHVTALDHYVLVCADVESMVAWYRDRLGLEPLRLDEWRRGEAPFPSLRIDESTIVDMLAGVRTGENVNHVALVVDSDLDELVASGEFDVVGGPAVLFGARGSGRGVYVRDPEGNLVELRSY